MDLDMARLSSNGNTGSLRLKMIIRIKNLETFGKTSLDLIMWESAGRGEEFMNHLSLVGGEEGPGNSNDTF